MKTEYKLIEAFADGGLTYIEREQDGDRIVLAEFRCSMDAKDAANLRELVVECQAQADDAAYWKQNTSYKVDQFSRISNEQIAVIKQLEKDRDTLQRERDALNEQLEELRKRKRKATGDERMAAAYETLRARYVKASDLLTTVVTDGLSAALELRIDKFMNNKE